MPVKTTSTKAKSTKATPRSARKTSGPAETATACKPVKKQDKSSAGKKPAAKKPSAKPAASASAKPKKAGPSKPALKKPSGLDLAAKVLGELDRPLNAREIAERVIAAGWTTTGKTPHATLYSAMLREIKGKGEKSRFVLAERGRFGVNNK